MKATKTLLTALTVSCLACGSAGAGLLTNGGFESDVAGTATPTAWTKTFGDQVKDSGGVLAGTTILEGENIYQVQGINTGASISQSVTVTTAGEYELSGWYAPRSNATGTAINNAAPATFSFVLLDATDAVVTPDSISGETNADLSFPWTELTRTYSLLAPGTYTVEFSISQKNIAGGNLTQGSVDDFSFALVPEPSSIALLGLGGLLVVRRRRG